MSARLSIRDPAERRYFHELPTSFKMEDEQVDRLREIAGRLLRESPEYGRVLAELGGARAAREGR